MVFLVLEVRNSVLKELTFAKSKILAFSKFEFFDLAYFLHVDRFLTSLSILSLPLPIQVFVAVLNALWFTLLFTAYILESLLIVVYNIKLGDSTILLKVWINRI